MGEALTVQCPNCQSQVPAADINIAALVAKCSHCSRVFRLPLEPEVRRPEVPRAAPPLACPAGVVRENGPGGELFIRRSWFSPALFPLLIVCVVWISFLIHWYSMALAHPAVAKLMGMPLLVPVFHVAVGAGMAYAVITGFLNSTRILIDGESLHIRHQPIPWPGNRDVPRSDIRGIEVAMSWTRNRRPMFSVSAIRSEGRQLKLLSNISYSHARYIGYQIAEYLAVDFVDTPTRYQTFPLPRWLQPPQR